jgi:DNA polymerase III epsilon subunit-like protein
MKLEHVLTRNDNCTYTCSVCAWTWTSSPQSPCPGVPRYGYGAWPSTLYTFTQLRRMKRKPIAGPAGCYFIQKSPYKRFLYDIEQSIPRRVPTPRQWEAIHTMRAALVQAYTCQRCHAYDSSHGRSRYGDRVQGGYCQTCRRMIEREDQHMARQAQICEWAAGLASWKGSWVVLDTETTGLSDADEIIELAIVSASGTVLFSSLIQPQDQERRELATHIHGITPDMLATAPTFPDVWPTIKAILRRYRQVLVYNSAFDRHLLTVTARRYGYKVPKVSWECLMEAYAVYHGAWHDYFHSYTWQKLEVACDHLGVEVSAETHRAVGDALRALGVLRALAEQHPPQEEVQV